MMKKNRKFTFLHVFDDDKFFDAVSTYFDALKNVKNLYYFYSPDQSFTFQKIKNSEKITVFHDFKEYVRWFSDDSVDAIYFQGLCDRRHFKLVNFIGKKQKVFWWSFGAELYNNDGLSPLIKLPLLKPETEASYRHFRNTTPRQLLKRLFFILVAPYYNRQRKRLLTRVDYHTPVLPLEHALLKQNVPYFNANPFMLQCGPTCLREFPFVFKQEPGNVLVGNSLTYTNNFLDIATIIRGIKIKDNRRYIFPISYGQDYNGLAVFKKLMSMDESMTVYFDDFVPIETYKERLNNVTHAIFGYIRQQGIGNIQMVMRQGAKIYLYKDSIPYKYYKSEGYIVFTIEDDLNEESLSRCLSFEEAHHNYELLSDLYTHAWYENVEKEIAAIFD